MTTKKTTIITYNESSPHMIINKLFKYKYESINDICDGFIELGMDPEMAYQPFLELSELDLTADNINLLQHTFDHMQVSMSNLLKLVTTLQDQNKRLIDKLDDIDDENDQNEYLAKFVKAVKSAKTDRSNDTIYKK
jgi:hypothetical protein